MQYNYILQIMFNSAICSLHVFLKLPFYLRSPNCYALGPEFTCTIDDPDSCTSGAACDPEVDYCTNINMGGGCGGPGVQRAVVGAFLGGYIILYGQVQSWTPQLVTGPLRQTPPNKITEVFWGMINCYPTMIGAIVFFKGEVFMSYQLEGMMGWLVTIIVTFAIIFAINSSIHSFLVVKYAAADKVAVSVGLYYMANAMGRLVGTLGSGFIYTYAGGDSYISDGYNAGSDARIGLAACFVAGTVCSFLAAIITVYIKDDDSGLKCGPCWTIVESKEADDDEGDEQEVTETDRVEMEQFDSSEIISC